MSPFWIKATWWMIVNLWNEFTWAILVGTITQHVVKYFPNLKKGWVEHWSVFARIAVGLGQWR
jgi:hypothetical protein